MSESASAQINLTSTTGTVANPVYHYDITVTDTGTTNVGTFWFAWLPGEDFLTSMPTVENSPSGWGSAITGSGAFYDGFAIQWVATSNLITPGQSLSGFDFSTPDSPAVLAGKSSAFPASDVLTSEIYKGAPLADPGFEFNVTPAATQSASTTTIAPSQSTINLGDSVTFTATVAPSSGSGADPTGSVTFLENGTSIGTQALVSGTAAFTTSALPSGSLAITAQYGGDSTYSGSTSSPITETVNPPGATLTSLMTSNASINSGDSVTLTATVVPVTPTGTAPTGNVSFSQDGNLLGTIAVQPDGTAQLVTSTLPIGADHITATYGGDTHFATSTSAATTETVNPGTAASTTALSTSAASIQSGVAVTFTATVAPATPGGATPTGTVSFSLAGNPLGSVPVQSDGTAAFSTSALPVGADNITATYSGDANYAASASAPLTETVTTPATLVPAITKSTIPAALVAGVAGHGAITLDITNTTVAAIKGKLTVEVFASTDGTIDSSAIELSQVVRALNVKTTRPSAMPLPIKIAPAALPAGSYTLLTRVVDLSGNNNDSTSGPTLTVAAPFVALSETFTRMTIPASAVAGAKAHAVVAIRITNNGNITTPGTTTLALFATLNGVVDGSATQITSVTKPLRIRAGKFTQVTLPIRQIPAIAAGTYTIVAQVTDANGDITTATAGMVTITAS